MEEIEVRAHKLTSKGKARFRLEDGTEGFVEEIALHNFRLEGWDGLWSENDYWWVLMSLLFWDVIFARVDGAGFSKLDSYLPTPRDMPMDFFTEDFYRRRRDLVGKRLEFLGSSDLVHEVLDSHARHHGEPDGSQQRFHDELPQISTLHG